MARVDTGEVAFDHPDHHRAEVEDFTLTRDLVRSKKIGRVRTYRLAPKRLRLAENWLVRQRNLWERRLDQLDEYLTELKEKRT